MAWQFKVTSVSGSEMRMEGEPPAPIEFDLTSTGQWRAHIQYFDSASPATVLYEEDFTMLSERTTAAQALEIVRAKGIAVRDTRAKIAQLQGNVGTVFNL